MENIQEPDYSADWKKIAESEDKYRKELQEKKDKFKEQLQELMNVDTVWGYLNDTCTFWDPEGSVNIQILNEKPDGRHEAIDLSDIEHEFTRQSEDLGECGVDHIYVWQNCGYSGDDYSGWMLYPLSNGRYLRVSYTC